MSTVLEKSRVPDARFLSACVPWVSAAHAIILPLYDPKRRISELWAVKEDGSEVRRLALLPDLIVRNVVAIPAP
ncbi:MAG TPA: hypothetical protein VE291_11175 [Terracidiphilus sp.]|jgi:hypothetical protein|nr:hypothetical protein [Terracidiphilus sp.]